MQTQLVDLHAKADETEYPPLLRRIVEVTLQNVGACCLREKLQGSG